MDDNPLDKIPDHITDMGSQEVFNYLGERLKQQQAGEPSALAVGRAPEGGRSVGVLECLVAVMELSVDGLCLVCVSGL